MNFILLSDYYYPIIKSGSIIMDDLASELIEQGHSITIITFVNNQSKRCEVSVEGKLQIIRIRTRVRQYGRIGRLWAENTWFQV